MCSSARFIQDFYAVIVITKRVWSKIGEHFKKRFTIKRYCVQLDTTDEGG